MFLRQAHSCLPWEHWSIAALGLECKSPGSPFSGIASPLVGRQERAATGKTERSQPGHLSQWNQSENLTEGFGAAKNLFLYPLSETLPLDLNFPLLFACDPSPKCWSKWGIVQI